MLELLLILSIIAFSLYIFIVFFLLRWVVPFFGYEPFVELTTIPVDMLKFINLMESKSNSQGEYLKLVYDALSLKWQGERLKTITESPKAWRTDIDEIWNSHGFAHCHTIDYIFFILLVKSKYFKPDDVRVQFVMLNFFIHQYLEVRVEGKWIDVDVWASNLGVPFGKHAELFK